MGRRAQDARCSVCFASVFGDLDDVNEPRPAVATECGHVIHEHCVLRWIEMSADAQLANKQIDYREEAEATCPQCRSEIYADEETGKPLIHRLFPVFDDEAGSSQAQSSPMKAEPVDEARSEELMGMARRAKAMKIEIGELGPENTVDQVGRAVGRVEGLKKDLEVSAKSISAIRTYVGGLIASINNLRSAITKYPLAPQLRDENNLLRAQLEGVYQTVRRVETDMNQKLKQEVRKAINEEQSKAVRLVEEQMKKVDQIKAELDRANAEKNASSKLSAERAKEMMKKVQRLDEQMKKNMKDKEAAEESEADKRKQLKRWIDKYEKLEKKNSDFKRENTTLAEENAALKAKIASRPEQSTRDLAWAEGDSSVVWLDPPATMSPGGRPEARQISTNDRIGNESSLLVDMPSFNDSFALQAKGQPTQRSTTAKTFSSDMFDNKAKKSKYFGRSEDARDISDISLKRKRNTSFSLSNLPEVSLTSSSPTLGMPERLPSFSPPPTVASTRNPFAKSTSSRSKSHAVPPASPSRPRSRPAPPQSDVLVPPSSPPGPATLPIVSPWDGVNESPSPGKKLDKGKGKAREYMRDEELASTASTLPTQSQPRSAPSTKTARHPLSSRSLQSSTDSIPNSRPSSVNVGQGAAKDSTPSKAKPLPSRSTAQQSILSMFADRNGKPKNGVISGSKSRKRI
ncbi:hypothetical protein IAR50_003162 [Cryptococcus sp. DSM 104548]